MLIELLSLSNYGHFNVKLANALGLHTAIYINIITDINEKAIRKKKTEKEEIIVEEKQGLSKKELYDLNKKKKEESKTKKEKQVTPKKKKQKNTSICLITLFLSVLLERIKKIDPDNIPNNIIVPTK